MLRESWLCLTETAAQS